MFRLRLTLIYLALTSLGVVLTLTLLSDAKSTGDARLVSEITRSHLVYDQLKKLRDLQLRDVAQAVAQSELAVYMGVLKKHRKTMHRVQKEVLSRFKGPDQKDARREALVNEYDDVHKTIAQDLADRLWLSRTGDPGVAGTADKAKFVSQTMSMLADCQSQSVKQCTYELARGSLVDVAKRLRKRPVHGVKPSILLIADDRFVGLADADRKFYYHDSRFGERFTVAHQVKKGSIARDIVTVDAGVHKGTFFISAAPIFNPEREFLGVVLAGIELDSSLLKADKKVLGRDVTYFYGKKPIRSTLKPNALDALVIESSPVDDQNPQLHTLQTEQTIAQFIPLTGNWSENKMRVAVSAGRDSARLLDGVTVWIPLLFGFLFVLGVALFMWAVHLFLTPAFEIDSGIHEIINGDKDYIFAHDYKTELWVGIAESLNLMVGELVGREMVDEEGFDDWARSYLKSAHEDDEVSAEGDEESDEEYYRRIFNEFSRLNQAAGKDSLSYAQFVERVARTEKMLSRKLGLVGVRLGVEEGAAGPVLKPVKGRPKGDE